MARGNFLPCYAVTKVYEGGYVNHPSDPGGETNFGITVKVARANGYHGPMRNIPLAKVQDIYRKQYWDTVGAETLPYGVDLATFDFGVNSGPPRAVRYLRSITTQEPKAIIQKLCAARLSFVRGLGTFKVFGRGWARRIADVEARAVAMWLARGGALSTENRDALRQEGGKARDTATTQDRGGTAAGGTGAAGGGAAATGGYDWLIILGLVVIAVAVAGFLFWKARQNKARAEAYEAVASEAAIEPEPVKS